MRPEIDNIVEAIHDLRDLMNPEKRILATYDPSAVALAANEFVLLIKPEATLAATPKTTHRLLTTVDETMAEFGAFVHGVAAMNSAYLTKNSIFQNQYFVLQRGAKMGQAALNKEQLARALNLGRRVIGAYAAIERYPGVNAWTLEAEAHRKGTTKLANGVYVSKHVLEGEDVVVVNAFHPAQIESLTGGGVCVALACHSERTYPEIAEELVGHFRPQEAGPCTLRGKLYAHGARLGVPNVGTLVNGFHLSPGALEAVRSIAAYFNLENDATNFGMSTLGDDLVRRGYSISKLKRLLENPSLKGTGGCVFDLFEGRGRLETLEILEELDYEFPAGQ